MGRPKGSKNSVTKAKFKKEEVRVKRKYTRRAKVEVATPVAATITNPEEGEDNMIELIAALTNLAKEATIYLAKRNGTLSDVTTTSSVEVPTATVVETATVAEVPAEAPVAIKRGRKPKAEVATTADDLMDSLGLPSEPAVPAKVAAPKAMTEAESTKLLMETATEYVNVFGKPKGIEMAKAHLKPYKTDKITALNHTQRIAYVAILKADLQKEMVAA